MPDANKQPRLMDERALKVAADIVAHIRDQDIDVAGIEVKPNNNPGCYEAFIDVVRDFEADWTEDPYK